MGPSVFHAPSPSVFMLSVSLRVHAPSPSVFMLCLPPCSCSVLIVNVNSPHISIHFAFVILRPPCSVTLRVLVYHAPMLHMTDHRPFPPRSIAIHRPCFRSSFQTLRSRFRPLTPPCHSCHHHSSLFSTNLRSQCFPATPGHYYLSDPLCHHPAVSPISIRSRGTLHIPCFPSFV